MRGRGGYFLVVLGGWERWDVGNLLVGHPGKD